MPSLRLLQVADDDRAHALGDPHEAGAGPVHADVLRARSASPARASPAATWNAAEDGSPGTWMSSSSSSSLLGARVTGRRRARRAAPARGEHALGVVAARRGLDHRRRARRQQAGDQHARLDLRGGHRQLVVDALAARAPRDRERRQAARRGARPARPSAAAARRRGRPAGGGSTRRRRASTRRRAGPRASPGSSRISVPALPTSIGRRCVGRRAGPAPRITSSPSRRSTHRAERLHRVQRRVRVRGVEVVA